MNQYLHAFILMELMSFFGFNCHRKVEELYQGAYGQVIQAVFTIGALISFVGDTLFTLGLFVHHDFTWYSPILLYLATCFIPLGNSIYMLLTNNERSWGRMFVVQILSLIGVLSVGVFMVRFFM